MGKYRKMVNLSTTESPAVRVRNREGDTKNSGRRKMSVGWTESPTPKSKAAQEGPLESSPLRQKRMAAPKQAESVYISATRAKAITAGLAANMTLPTSGSRTD